MSGGARVCPVLGRGRGGRRCLLLSPFFFPFDGLTFGENNVHTTHARERAASPFVTLSTGLAGWLRTAQTGAAAAAPTVRVPRPSDANAVRLVSKEVKE